ncbi:hypothetical protein, partial [Klebsiella grimontii]|uniref:hypothetical protein n=1 Tax=Klebsiella grimontii TaxID=2058152 RepID=UPI001C49B816
QHTVAVATRRRRERCDAGELTHPFKPFAKKKTSANNPGNLQSAISKGCIMLIGYARVFFDLVIRWWSGNWIGWGEACVT